MKKQKIAVRTKEGITVTAGKTLDPLFIYRKVWMEAIGNFNPMFCRYMGKRTLVHSDAGDISDPFRRQESYLNTLFIKIDL